MAQHVCQSDGMKLHLSAKIINTVVCILFCMTSLTFISCKDRSPGPFAVQGVLDLGGWNLAKDGVVTLDGEWEFCRGRLMEPSDFSDKGDREGCGFITVPGLWKHQRFNGAMLPGRGSATYRLKILSRSDAGWATLSLRRILSGYTLWINGKLKDKKGTPDRLKKTREDYVYVHNKRQSSFILNKGENEIVLQVINDEYESGGITMPLYLEDREACTQRGLLHYSVHMIIVGLLLFSAIYNVLFYFYRKEDMVSLHLAFFSLVTAVNTYNIQNPIISGALSWPPNPFLINYITAILTVILPLVIAGSLFPDDVSLRFVRFYQFLCFVFIVPLFFLRFNTAEQLFKVFMIFMAIFLVYMIYVIVKSLIYGRNDARLFFIGFLTLVVTGVNNILYSLWIIDTGNMLPFAMVIFCIVTTTVVSRRFARALQNVEDLSKELETKNISLQKMDRIKDQFLANTSHELRTPLHGMIGLSESMIEGAVGSLSPKAIENLSLIASSGHRLANMVNDLLDMARIQDEGLHLHLRPVDLCALSEMVVNLSLPLVGRKHLVIINRIKQDTPRVHADEDRIRQVLYNLVGNAIKFTNEGTIDISASVIDTKDENHEYVAGKVVEIRVSDTGIGIPDEYKEKIFEAYRQIDGSDTRPYPGTGLGLTIAKQIIELHKGTISVSSGRDGGTIFSFTLPASDDPVYGVPDEVIIERMYDPILEEGVPGSSGLPDGIQGWSFENNPVFLVVDDDPVNIRVIRNYFEPMRCRIETASDGISALDIIEKDDSIDLVLLDIMMPVMSGYEVCRRIRAAKTPEELPVIMLTAKNMMSDINAAFEAGANDYIVKPFQIIELVTRVNTMLKLGSIRKSAAEGITIRDRHRVYSFKFSEISHIISHSKHVVIHWVGGEIELPVLLKDITDRLPPDIFVRIHKSHVINLQYLHSISHVLSGRYRVRLRDDDDTELPVGSAFLESLRKKI